MFKSNTIALLIFKYLITHYITILSSQSSNLDDTAINIPDIYMRRLKQGT